MEGTAQLEVVSEPFGLLPDGRAVDRWTFGLAGGVQARMLTLGATLHELYVPDRDGNTENVVLGAPDAAALLGPARYLGSTVGRYANRISDGELPLMGQSFLLRPNEGESTVLHGGPDGYDQRIWSAEPLVEGEPGAEPERVGVRFRLHSPDGDEGFPGALELTADFTVDRSGTLTAEYRAVTDAPTVVNLTNHAYFNLAGEGSGNVLDHLLQVAADAYTPLDAASIPLGPHAPVAGTRFDFTAEHRIGEHPGGYDNNWVLRGGSAEGGAPAVVLRERVSGRRLEVRTTEPGVQIYTANHLDGSGLGPSGRPYHQYGGVALETQHFPDSPHQPEYPTTVLLPGEQYHSVTHFHFSTED